MTSDARLSPAQASSSSSTAPLVHAALECAMDGVLVLDDSGRIVIASRRFAELLQAAPAPGADGHAALDLLADSMKDPGAYRERLSAIRSDPGRESLDTLELADGRLIERHCAPFVMEGRPAGMLLGFRDVTRSRRAEERLKESEERFRLIAENVGDLVAMIDPSGRRLYNSPSYGTLFARDDIEPGSDSFQDIHPDDRAGIRTIFEETVRTGVGRPAEFRFLLKDGSVRHIESEGRVIKDASGRVSKVVVVSRDISERKHSEQRRRMEHEVTRVLADSETLQQAIPRIIETICGTLDWDCGARWSMDADSKAIRCMESWGRHSAGVAGFLEATRAMSLAPGHGGLVRQVWLSGEPKWIAEVSLEQGFIRGGTAAAAGLHSAFAFPIRAGSVTLGVLEFFSRQIRPPDEALLQMVRVIGSQIGQFTARKQAEENLLYVATHDTLTGLPNRYLLNQRFTHAITQSQRYGRPLALLFMDLDRFKIINDTEGHPYGDQLLVQAGRRLRDCLRDSDTIARFGGDEFVALIEEFGSPADVESVAQKMLEVVRRPFLIEGRECSVTGSVGISLFPEDGRDFATLLKNADRAIYRAKEAGRDAYVFHSTHAAEEQASSPPPPESAASAVSPLPPA